MTSLGQLWGGTILDLRIDLIRQNAILHVSVQERGGLRNHYLTITGLGQIQYANVIPAPWAYAELTEVRAETIAAGVRVSMVLWHEDATLVIEGEQLLLETLADD